MRPHAGVAGRLPPALAVGGGVVLALLALSTAILTTPWVLLRTRPAALAMSGCRKLELNTL